MRIGIFTDTFPPEVNGVAVSTMILQQELIKHGHEVFVITTNNSLLHSQKDGNILRLPGVELKVLYGYILSSPVHMLAYNDIKEMNLDIIHVQTEFGLGIFGRITGYLLKIPVIATYHTTYEEYTHYVVPGASDNFMNKIAKRAVRQYSKVSGDSCIMIIAPSEKTKEMLVQYQVKKPIKVIPTGIDLERFCNKSTPNELALLKKELNISDDDFVLLYVGRLAAEKSIDVVIKSLTEVVADINNLRVVIVGDGPSKENLINLTKKLNLEQFVTFVGKVPAEDVPKYYHLANCFVSASTTETQGITYIEALASSLVTFAADKDVVKDLVVEGKTGYYFTDESELAKKLIAYYNLAQKQKKVMENSCFEKTKQYSNEIFYQNIIETYQEVVDGYYHLYEVQKITNVGENLQLTIKNQVQEIQVLVSDEDYLKYNLKKDQVLTNELVEALKAKEMYLKTYAACLKILSRKDHTTKEMYDFILKESTLKINDINEIIEKLTASKLLDDKRYVFQVINSRKSQTWSKGKVIKTLKDKGINIDIINEVFNDNDTLDDYTKALAYAEKLVSTLGRKSSVEVKNTLKNRLMSRGYNYSVVYEVLENITIPINLEDEFNYLEKAVHKVYQRYSKKYQQPELNYKIKAYLLAKGYNISDIEKIIADLEVKNNED
ncbi:MAG: glycosyltransferase [Erysipelotrichaceae bacterium]